MFAGGPTLSLGGGTWPTHGPLQLRPNQRPKVPLMYKVCTYAIVYSSM